MAMTIPVTQNPKSSCIVEVSSIFFAEIGSGKIPMINWIIERSALPKNHATEAIFANVAKVKKGLTATCAPDIAIVARFTTVVALQLLEYEFQGGSSANQKYVFLVWILTS